MPRGVGWRVFPLNRDASPFPSRAEELLGRLGVFRHGPRTASSLRRSVNTPRFPLPKKIERFFSWTTKRAPLLTNLLRLLNVHAVVVLHGLLLGLLCNVGLTVKGEVAAGRKGRGADGRHTVGGKSAGGQASTRTRTHTNYKSLSCSLSLSLSLSLSQSVSFSIVRPAFSSFALGASGCCSSPTPTPAARPRHRCIVHVPGTSSGSASPPRSRACSRSRRTS